MTPKDFVIWMKGFVQASNNFNLTPKQWDDLREMLDRVELGDKRGTYTISANSSMSSSTKYLLTEETEGVL